MTRVAAIGLLVLASVASASAADGFLRDLPPEDFAAAGLNKLSPEELARLEAIIQRHEATPAATAPASAAPTASSGAKPRPRWFEALLTLKRVNEQPDNAEPLTGQLAGDFEGWSGTTIFRLQDGSSWIQQNKSEAYPYSPTLHSPKVTIRPAAFHGYWLEIEGVNRQVRVVPFNLADGR